MTNQEAIRILQAGATFSYDEISAEEFCTAYDMAVKALEAQDVDAISRQAVMWMLTNLSYNQCKTQGEADLIDTAKTMVITMPSAQTVDKDINVSCKDVISRQAAIDAIVAWTVEDRPDVEMPTDLVGRINALPSAQPEPSQIARDIATIIENEQDMRVMLQPEIIRCKDCKHYYYADNRIPQEQRFVCELEGERWKPDDYCSYAERRTDEADYRKE